MSYYYHEGSSIKYVYSSTLIFELLLSCMHMHTFGVLPSSTYDDLHYLAHNAFLNEKLL